MDAQAVLSDSESVSKGDNTCIHSKMFKGIVQSQEAFMALVQGATYVTTYDKTRHVRFLLKIKIIASGTTYTASLTFGCIPAQIWEHSTA